MLPPLDMARTPWDPNTMGYGRHPFRHIDPTTINPEDYAQGLRGEEKHMGDVREYNTAYNEKHPETNMDLYDLGLMGTRFTTTAEGMEGVEWEVVEFPHVNGTSITTKVRPMVEGGEMELRVVDTVSIGLVVNDKNLFEQVVTKITKRGMIDREQRKALSSGVSTRDRLKAGIHGPVDKES